MVMEDNESSCNSSRAATTVAVAAETTSSASGTAAPNSRQHRQKLEVYNEVLRRLKESENQESVVPCFDDELWAHFNRLPVRLIPFPNLILFFKIIKSQDVEFFFLMFWWKNVGMRWM